MDITNTIDPYRELAELGFKPRVETDDDGRASTWWCAGSLAVKVEVDLEATGPAPVRVIIQHAEWDAETGMVTMTALLDEHDLGVLARALPALRRLTGIGRRDLRCVATVLKGPPTE